VACGLTALGPARIGARFGRGSGQAGHATAELTILVTRELDRESDSRVAQSAIARCIAGLPERRDRLGDGRERPHPKKVLFQGANEPLCDAGRSVMMVPS
jgi:hypothetical protein